MKALYMIYGLTDPTTNQLRYVGQTKVVLRTRLTAHVNEKGNTRKNQWIRSLKAKSALPQIFEIDSCCDFESCMDLEIFWIAYFKAIGCNLVNHTIGGMGVSGSKHSEESKRKRSEARKGHKLSIETKQKISDTKRDLPESFFNKMRAIGKSRPKPVKAIAAMHLENKTRSAEEKARIGAIVSKSNKTRIVSDETRAKYSKVRSIPCTEEKRLKISATMKAKKWKYSEERVQKRLDTIKKNKDERIKRLSTK